MRIPAGAQRAAVDVQWTGGLTGAAPAVALPAHGVLGPRPLHTATVPLSRPPEAFERLDSDPWALRLLVAP